MLPRVATSLSPNEYAQPGRTVRRCHNDWPWRGSPPLAHLAWLAPSSPQPIGRALGQGSLQDRTVQMAPRCEAHCGQSPQNPCEHKVRSQLAQDTRPELVATEGRQGLNG